MKDVSYEKNLRDAKSKFIEKYKDCKGYLGVAMGMNIIRVYVDKVDLEWLPSTFMGFSVEQCITPQGIDCFSD